MKRSKTSRQYSNMGLRSNKQPRLTLNNNPSASNDSSSDEATTSSGTRSERSNSSSIISNEILPMFKPQT